MDDMKRAIYMLALEKTRKIKKRNPTWVCCNLNYALMEIMGTNYDTFNDEEFIEFFSEFFQLYDGRRWDRGARYIELDLDQDSPIGKPWWKYDWGEPRIRILNYILCQH